MSGCKGEGIVVTRGERLGRTVSLSFHGRQGVTGIRVHQVRTTCRGSPTDQQFGGTLGRQAAATTAARRRAAYADGLTPKARLNAMENAYGVA